MITHIRLNFKPMQNLFLVMKSCETPTADEILMALGKKHFDNSIQAEYLQSRLQELKKLSQNSKWRNWYVLIYYILHSFYLVSKVLINIFRNLGIKKSLSGF